jgi:hypothetical protein
MGAASSSVSQIVNNSTLQKSVMDVMINQQNNSSNSISLVQTNSLYLGAGGVSECPIVQSNDINADMKLITSIDSQTVVDMKAKMMADITSTAGQTNKIIREMGSSLGSIAQDNFHQALTTRAEQIVEKHVTVKKVNSIMNGVMLVQNNAMYINGRITKDACPNGQGVGASQGNNIVLTLVAQSVITDVVKAATSDEVVTRLVAQADQSTTLEATGFASIIKALTGPMIAALIVGIIAFAVVGKQGVKSLADPKFAIAVGGLIALYLGVAYFAKLFPFLPKKPSAPSTVATPWVCDTYAVGPSAGLNTGGCVRWTSPAPTPQGMKTFDTKAECDKNATYYCPVYWGCAKDASEKFTGACVQHNNASDGPYLDQTQCDNAVANKTACRYYYGCGYGDDKGNCVSYDNISDGPWKSVAECQAAGCSTAPAPAPA